jgi:hypothetical protein
MSILKLTKSWIAPHGRLKPGEYRIPDKISRAHAQCAVIDGAGHIVKASVVEKPKEEEKPRARGRPAGRRKAVAPENKLLNSAPENKSEVEGAAGDGGSDGAFTDGGSSGDLPGEPPVDDSGQ